MYQGVKNLRISSIHTQKASFGYDKKLNQELKEQLSEYPDRQWAKTISTLNSYCNGIEANLKREEKNTNSTRYSDYLDIFLSAKQMLAGFVEITFENLHFADREYKHYDDEFIKNGSNKRDWRKEICNYLLDWTTTIPQEKPNKPAQDTKIRQTDNKADIKQSEQEQIIKETNKAEETETQSLLSLLTPKSFLEEYKPEEQSPKGFADVAGMAELKRDLQEGIIQLVQNPQQAQLDFEEYGKTIPKGILLFGPPGCGKTYITQALASEIDTPMYMLNISKAGSHYINMTSKNIKSAFDEAIKIAEKTDKPCLLFMDEIDSLGFDRNSRMEPDDLKQVSTMLQAMDSAKKSNVIIIGATNKYNLLDPAIRRRFDKRILVDIPDTESIAALITKNLQPMKKGQKLLSSPEEIQIIAEKLKGYSNSSICNITKEAALNAMRRDRADIEVQDFEKAIEMTSEEKPDRQLYMAESKANTRKIGFN